MQGILLHLLLFIKQYSADLSQSLQLLIWVSQVDLPSHIQSDWLLPFLFFTFITQRDFPTATFYRQQFLNTLKYTFVSNFCFIFASNFILVFSHHDLVTHVYSQSIVPGCQEQTVYRTWSTSYLAVLNMLSHTTD